MQATQKKGKNSHALTHTMPDPQEARKTLPWTGQKPLRHLPLVLNITRNPFSGSHLAK